MKLIHLMFAIPCLAHSQAAIEPARNPTPANGWADVRMSLPEFKKLLADERAAVPAGKSIVPPVAAAVLAARLALAWPESGPLATMDLEVENFSDTWQAVPVFGKAVTLASVEPAGTRMVLHDGRLCILLPPGARQSIKLQRGLGADDDSGHLLDLPVCATLAGAVTSMPAGTVIGLTTASGEMFVRQPGAITLPAGAGSVRLRRYPAAEIDKLTSPPVASPWEWQNQVVVVPDDGELACTAFSRIAATEGNGMETTVVLPREVRAIAVEAADMDGPVRVTRGADGLQHVRIQWKTRDQLDRQLVVSYRLPVGPLDKAWDLPAPRGEEARPPRSQFILATTAGFAYQAGGLSAPVRPDAMPARVGAALAGRSCQLLDGTTGARVGVEAQRLAATSETSIHEAVWQSRLEPDGAILHEGNLTVDHRGAAICLLDLPEGANLLACTVGGVAVKPRVDGASKLAIPMPPGAAILRSSVAIAFTLRAAAVHPVDGTMPMALPESPDFIRSLRWTITLPAGYQAETHGNMIREDLHAGESRHTLRLAKNLCRAERPAVTIFYQRANLAD